MPYKILIVDDDGEFNNLLMDVFRQAGYIVEAEEKPDRALARISEGDFDLIVSDQKFPQGSGLQMVRSVRAEHPDIPIVMVSGFLDNDTIRDLIREGIRGVFMKPLNIFSLLKKAGELIESSQTRNAEGESDGAIPGMRSFPCISARSRDFAVKLRELAGFRRNLILIGPEGMPFEDVCKDLCGMATPPQQLVVLPGRVTREADIEAALATGSAEQPLTLAFLDGDKYSDEIREIIYAIAARQGRFATLTTSVRMIFCLNEEVDTLYDKGLIDEEFYLFLGTNELKMPALNEVREDIPVFAERCMEEIQPGLQLDHGVRNFLSRQPWPGNLEDMRKVLIRAVRSAGGRAPKLEQVQSALSPTAGKEAQAGGERNNLETFLLREKAIFDLASNRLTQHQSSPERLPLNP